MGYRSCLGLIRLAQQYSAQRMEAAAERALLAQACRYQSVKSILKNSLDAVPLSPPRPGSPPLRHDNLRGAPQPTRTAVYGPVPTVVGRGRWVTAAPMPIWPATWLLEKQNRTQIYFETSLSRPKLSGT